MVEWYLQGKTDRSPGEKTSPIATLSTTNPTCTGLWSNPATAPKRVLNWICVWPCIINVGKVIWKNQLDATIIYWSTRSAQHVLGQSFAHLQERKTDIFTAYSIVSCCDRQGSLRESLPITTTGHYIICCKNLSLTLLKMGKRLPETCWADLVESWIFVRTWYRTLCVHYKYRSVDAVHWINVCTWRA